MLCRKQRRKQRQKPRCRARRRNSMTDRGWCCAWWCLPCSLSIPCSTFSANPPRPCSTTEPWEIRSSNSIPVNEANGPIFSLKWIFFSDSLCHVFFCFFLRNLTVFRATALGLVDCQRHHHSRYSDTALRFRRTRSATEVRIEFC